MPDGEVKFFASFPHAHLTGNGIWTNILRNGKEIKEVMRDENYDFNYQVFTCESKCSKKSLIGLVRCLVDF